MRKNRISVSGATPADLHTRGHFTLLEVVIAIAILSLGVVTAMSVIMQSNNRMERAYNKWREQHIISQAAEFYLLQGVNAQPTQDVFPYSSEGYSVSCVLEEPTQLPSSVEAHSHNWRLALLKITLTRSDGQIASILRTEKILKEDNP